VIVLMDFMTILQIANLVVIPALLALLILLLVHPVARVKIEFL